MRKSALWNIEISKKTLPFIIKMASDADYQLRSSVFKKLNRERPEYNLLSTEQREDLLHKGLTDS